MLQDILIALRAAVREYRRLRWRKQRIKQISLPF